MNIILRCGPCENQEYEVPDDQYPIFSVPVGNGSVAEYRIDRKAGFIRLPCGFSGYSAWYEGVRSNRKPEFTTAHSATSMRRRRNELE